MLHKVEIDFSHIHLQWFGGSKPPVYASGNVDNATRNLSNSVNISVVGWDKANDFIVAIALEASSGGKMANTNCRLEWQNKTDGSGFVVLGNTGELTYNGATNLVEGNSLDSGEAICTPVNGATYIAGSPNGGVEKEGAATFTVGDGGTTNQWSEFQFSVNASNALANKEYEFRVYDVDNSVALGPSLATLMTAVEVTIHSLVGSVDSISLLSGGMNVKRPIAGSADSITLLSGGLSIEKNIIGLINSNSLLLGALGKNSITYQDDAASSSWTTGSKVVTIDVAAGDLIVVAIGASNSDVVCTGVTDDIGNSYTLRPALIGSNTSLVMAYVLSSIGTDATNVITATFGSAVSATRIIIASSYEPDSGETISLEDSSSKISGYEASPWETPTDEINTTGTDELLIAAFVSNGSKTYTNHEIPSGTAADGVFTLTTAVCFYRILTETISNAEAEVDSSGSDRYVAEILAFKSEPAGGETHALVGSADSVSLLSGSIILTKIIIGSSDSVSLLTGAIAIDRTVTGSADSISLLTGTLSIIYPLAGSTDSISLLSGNIVLDKTLIGSADSVTLLSGAIKRSILIVGSADTITSLTGNINVSKLLSGSSDSITLLTGSLKAARLIALTGSADSVSLLSGSINRAINIIGSTDSVSLLTGNLSIIGAVVTHPLEGTVNSISLLTGSINVTKDLSGSADSVSLLSGLIEVLRDISGSADSISLLSGLLNIKRDISGSVDSISLLSGAIAISRNLLGQIETASLLSGELSVALELVGGVSSVTLLAGILEGLGYDEILTGDVIITEELSSPVVLTETSVQDVILTEAISGKAEI